MHWKLPFVLVQFEWSGHTGLDRVHSLMSVPHEAPSHPALHWHSPEVLLHVTVFRVSHVQF